LCTIIGDICWSGQGKSPDYVCMSAKKCDSLANKIKNLEYPDICSFNGTYPIVCCLPSTGGPSSLNLTKKKNSNVVNESMCINILVYVDIMIIINTCSLLNYVLNKFKCI